jgi:hypothetical protein
LEEVQAPRQQPQAMRQRREAVKHPFDTMKARVAATHFGARVFAVFAVTGRPRPQMAPN